MPGQLWNVSAGLVLPQQPEWQLFRRILNSPVTKEARQRSNAELLKLFKEKLHLPMCRLSVSTDARDCKTVVCEYLYSISGPMVEALLRVASSDHYDNIIQPVAVYKL